MPDRRKHSEEFMIIREEMSEIKERLDILNGKVSLLDDDFRNHEANEKPLFDELLVAVHNNSTKAEEIRDSVRGYVELQEDLTIMVRFAKKVGGFMTALGKFTLIFGISGAFLKYIYDLISKYIGVSF